MGNTPTTGKHRRLKGTSSKRAKRTFIQKYHKMENILKDSVVVNLSDHKLDKTTECALNKGLGFIPSTNRPNLMELDNDVARFHRRLQLHLFFADEPKDDFGPDGKTFIPKSTWMPKRLNPEISEFCDDLKQNIKKILQKRAHPNISERERINLAKLKANKNLVIKPADKGGGIAVINTADYVSKINGMLADKLVYSPVLQDDSVQTKERADQLLRLLLMEKLITDKQFRFLTEFQVRTPLFYGLPKLHKQDIPFRPVVSQINGPTSMINRLVDMVLTVAEKSIPFLLQDTTAFLNLIEKNKQIRAGDILLTLDVTALYTNIPQEEGVKLVCEYYEETLHLWKPGQIEVPPIPVEYLEILIKFILQNCTFEFNGKLFKQNFGTTMGASFSVKYANIYMNKLLTKIFTSYYQDKPEFVARLIDDIFTIWTYGEDSLKAFLTFLNKYHDKIKFTAEYSTSEVHFLDTVVYIDSGTLKTRVYTKPTDKKQFLYFSSCHPEHIPKSIPYAQSIRYRRNTSDDEVFIASLKILENQFQKRGYPQDLLESELSRSRVIKRMDTLVYKSTADKRAKFDKLLNGRTFLPCIITFYDQFRNRTVQDIFKQMWPKFISKSEKIKQVFENEFPMVVFKKGKTIGNHLVSAKLPFVFIEDPDLITLLSLCNNSVNPIEQDNFLA